MVFFQFFHTSENPVEESDISTASTMKSLLRFYSLGVLLSDIEVGIFGSFHGLGKRPFLTEIPIQNAVFTKKEVSNTTTTISKPFPNTLGVNIREVTIEGTIHVSNVSSVIPIRPNTFIYPGFQIGFCRSIHGLNEKICLETVDENPNLVSEKIAEDAEKICTELANQPSSTIESSLGRLGVVVSPALVEEVLTRLSNAGSLALAFFRWAEKQEGFKHSTETFHFLIEALGKIKQFRVIWSLVDTMKAKGLLTKETFALVIRRYARARKIKEAIETFEKMVKYGLEPDLSDFNKLIDIISKSSHVKRAQEIFDDMKKKRRFSPDVKSYTILLEGWGEDRNLLRLKEVYQEMKDEGFEPDVITYGILIKAYCKARKVDEAVKIFNEMEVKNFCPSPHIYCTLINGLGSDKRLDEALKYFELSKGSGFNPEIPTYNAVVGSFCWAMQFEDAYRMLDEMRKCGVPPNSRTFDIIIHHLKKVGKRKEAYEIFQKMSGESGCEPGLSTYTMMVGMFCAAERVDMALRVWKQMNDKGVLPCMHMFSSLIHGLCKENRLDEACSYFQEMMNMGIRPPGQLYSALKEALLDAGKKDLALNLGEKLDVLRRTSLNG